MKVEIEPSTCALSELVARLGLPNSEVKMLVITNAVTVRFRVWLGGLSCYSSGRLVGRLRSLSKTSAGTSLTRPAKSCGVSIVRTFLRA